MELTGMKEHQDVWRWLSLYLEYWLVQCVLGVSYSLLPPDKIDTLLNSKNIPSFHNFFNIFLCDSFTVDWLIDELVFNSFFNSISEISWHDSFANRLDTVDSHCLEFGWLEFPVESNFYRSPELRCV
jgi:hypothetical protein